MNYEVTHTDRDGCILTTEVQAKEIYVCDALIFFVTEGGQTKGLFPVETLVSVVTQENMQEETTEPRGTGIQIQSIDYSQDIHPILTDVVSHSNVQHIKVDDIQAVITSVIATLRRDPGLRLKILG